MKALSVAELEAKLSKVLAEVRRGERIAVLESKIPVAMIVPYEAAAVGRRDVGFLDGEVTIEFTDDFEMTEEELLGGA